VRDDMLNGHDICHGGLVTTLADSAFAFACNGYNEVTVASGFDCNLVAAAKGGDRLTAVASEVVNEVVNEVLRDASPIVWWRPC
jgi:acyl-CoA thioesterase